MLYREITSINNHWNKIQKLTNKITPKDVDIIIDKIIEKYELDETKISDFQTLKVVLKYPKQFGQTHCFDKYLSKYLVDNTFNKFIITKFEQSGGTFELCLYSYFSTQIDKNICVICLMNFNNQKDQLEDRFNMFNEYLVKNNIKPLNIKYIRDFKKSGNITDSNDVDIIVCLYNNSSMKLTFEKVCALAYMNDKKLSFAYDEIDIPESQKDSSKLFNIHTEILRFHPTKITNIFGVSATTLGNIPGSFLEPCISDIIFKPPSDTWSGIGHPSVKLFILDEDLQQNISRDNIHFVIKKIIKLALKHDTHFIGHLYSEVINVRQEETAIMLANKIPGLVVFIFNGSTSNNGGKFTILNSPILGPRHDSKKNELTLHGCFEHINLIINTKQGNKFIFVDHNMVLRGISIKGCGLNITDEIIFKKDKDIGSSSQKYQRIAGLNMNPRRIYGDEIILNDILRFQLLQTEIYTNCEIEALDNPTIKLKDFINKQELSINFSQQLSRNPTTKKTKLKGKTPLIMDVSRHLNVLKTNKDLIPIIKKNIKNKFISKENSKDWIKVIKYIENDRVNKNQGFLLDKHAQSIIDKHWLIHYNNMEKNKGSCFSAGVNDHSKNSLCYIGVMKNKEIKGYGKCMVVFTDKKIKNILIVEN
jgi:hypothetical protein